MVEEIQMNNKRYLHIILIFLVCMISISAVSAADDSLNEISEADDNQEVILEDSINEDVLTNNENDELILEENNAEDEATLSEGTSTGTFTDLNNAINGNSDSTVTLNRNYTYNGVDNYDAAFKKGIVLNRPVTIDGQGHTLNGNNLSRIFYIRDTNKVIIKNINFINGNAGDDRQGGAVYLGDIGRDYKVINCSFSNNTAIYAGAMCLGTAINCTFIENKALGDSASCGGAMTYGTAINCTFIQNSANGAIAMGGATYSTDAYNCSFVLNHVDGNEMPPEGNPNDPVGDAGVGGAMIYGIANNCTFINNHAPFNEDNRNTFGTACEDCRFYGDAIINASNFKTNSNSGDILPFKVGILEYGSHSYSYPNGINVTITLWKGGKLLDEDYALTGKGWPVNLPEGTYNAILSVWGVKKNITISVKITTKLTAKAKTFKLKTKTKKYTITLKDNKNKAMKNKKVTLKVKGKTYTAKTNSKGKATFKLTKLTKKGKYTAVIKYAGDKYYKKATKKVKITVKAPAKKKTTWKTVCKGSKDKATIKKIQKALKNNGYYLTYKGRYLKIDGIYHKYTVSSVKQFQKAKGLKVTGKVNYANAKKLKIVS